MDFSHLLRNWQNFLAADAQRLVELAARLEDVGDLAQGYSSLAHVTQLLKMPLHLIEQAFSLDQVSDLTESLSGLSQQLSMGGDVILGRGQGAVQQLIQRRRFTKPVRAQNSKKEQVKGRS